MPWINSWLWHVRSLTRTFPSSSTHVNCHWGNSSHFIYRDSFKLVFNNILRLLWKWRTNQLSSHTSLIFSLAISQLCDISRMFPLYNKFDFIWGFCCLWPSLLSAGSWGLLSLFWVTVSLVVWAVYLLELPYWVDWLTYPLLREPSPKGSASLCWFLCKSFQRMSQESQQDSWTRLQLWKQRSFCGSITCLKAFQ